MLIVVVVEVENVQHGLGIVLLLLFADVRGQQQPLPCFGHTLKEMRNLVSTLLATLQPQLLIRAEEPKRE